MKCNYGCGQEAKYEMTSGKWCCSEKWQICPGFIEKCNKNKRGRTYEELYGKDEAIKRKDDLSKRMKINNPMNNLDPWNKGKTGVYSEETLELLRTSRPTKGKNWEYIYGKEESHNRKIKASKRMKEWSTNREPWNKGIEGCFSKDTKKQMRLSAIKRIESNLENGGQCTPNYNPAGCKLIDNYGKQHNYNFQHAENGGEYFIKELGYWVDGYDKEKNVVIEIDESYHFDMDGNLSERDVQRQKQIEEYLNCKIIRLKI